MGNMPITPPGPPPPPPIDPTYQRRLTKLESENHLRRVAVRFPIEKLQKSSKHHPFHSSFVSFTQSI